MPAKYGIHISQNTCAIVWMYSKAGLTVYLPGKVVWRSFNWPPQNFPTGEKGLKLQKKIFQHYFKAWQQTLRSSPSSYNESGHNTRTKEEFYIPAGSDKPFEEFIYPMEYTHILSNFQSLCVVNFHMHFLFFFTLLYGMSCLLSFIVILSMSIQPYGCKDNKILSYIFSVM